MGGAYGSAWDLLHLEVGEVCKTVFDPEENIVVLRTGPSHIHHITIYPARRPQGGSKTCF